MIVIEKKFTLEEIYELFAEWEDLAGVPSYLYEASPFPVWLEHNLRREEKGETDEV